MQLARTVIWGGCTIILATFETVTVTLLDHCAVLTDKRLLTFQRIVVLSLSAVSKGFTASCLCLLVLWFFYELVLIGYFFWKGA